MTCDRRRVWYGTLDLLVALALVLVTGCSGADKGSPPAGTGPAGDKPTVSSAARVSALVDTFIGGDTTGTYDDVRAILVLRGGHPLTERYYDSSADATSSVFSVTKSVMSILIGIALDEGDLRDLDQTLGQLLPRYAKQMTSTVAGITLRQVLTMTAGLPEDGPNNETTYDSAKDWVGAIVSGPLEQPPGHRFAYASAGSHLLSAILVQATGRSVLDFAREKLFDPLGIATEPAAEPLFAEKNRAVYEAASFAWAVDPQGLHLGDGTLKISAPDMAKIGRLMLAGGRWRGKQIVSSKWVAESTRTQVPTRGPDVNNTNPTDHYGYQWWITTADGHHAFAAVGFGGQLIEVVPALDLVVAIASTVPDDFDQRLNAGLLLFAVDQVIAPALTR